MKTFLMAATAAVVASLGMNSPDGEQTGWISLLVAGLLVILIGVITFGFSKPKKRGS